MDEGLPGAGERSGEAGGGQGTANNSSVIQGGGGGLSGIGGWASAVGPLCARACARGGGGDKHARDDMQYACRRSFHRLPLLRVCTWEGGSAFARVCACAWCGVGRVFNHPWCGPACNGKRVAVQCRCLRACMLHAPELCCACGRMLIMLTSW